MLEECLAIADQSLDKKIGTAFDMIYILNVPHDTTGEMKFDLSTSRGSGRGCDRSSSGILKPTDLILITTCALPKKKWGLLSPNVHCALAIVARGSKKDDGESNQPVKVIVRTTPQVSLEFGNPRRKWYVALLDSLATALRVWEGL